MSQGYDIPLVGTFNGALYAAKIKDTTDALLSSHIGASRPSYAVQGTFWAKSVNSTTIEIYFFDGTSDILWAIFNPTAHTLTTAALPNNGVTIAKLEQIASGRILGRSTAGSGNVEVLTPAQVAALLPDFVGDSGAGGVKGMVPAPAAGEGAAGYVLHADGAWGPPASGVPAGVVAFTAADSAPTGWLLAYGQEISRSTYAQLFAAIGTTHGAGNGSTTFLVPDLRSRVPAGKDDMGGVAAGRLTGGAVLGASLGAETVTLVLANLPPITVSIPLATGTGSASTNPGRGFLPDGGSKNVSAGGTSTPVNKVQPTIILNGIIKI